MQATTSRHGSTEGLAGALRNIPSYFSQPVRLARAYDRANIRPDLIAGITVGVVALPQGIAFAILAGLPPEMGVYTAIVAAFVAALWGSSNQLNSGPTNTHSLLVFSILLPIALPGTPIYIAAAGLLAVMTGAFRVVMGLARLGVLVNFVSDAVIVGFTAGAGILIIIGQMRVILGLSFPNSPRLTDTVSNLFVHVPETHLITLLVAVGTIVITVLIRHYRRSWPAPLIVMGLSALIVWALGLQEKGVAVMGNLPRGLPPIANLPLLDLNMIGDLSTGALALAVIGLVEAVAIGRALSAQTGQRLDSNQEFVGQGLANIAAGVFSGFPTSGSFNRSSLNLESGARSPVASALSGVTVLVIVFVFAPVAVYVPLPTISAMLIMSAYGMIDRQEMSRIWNTTTGDRLIMVTTIAATLLLPLQFAVLTGVLMSLAYYIWRTSLPRVFSVVPDHEYKHLTRQIDRVHDIEKDACPQLGILEIQGDLYFGAAQNVEDAVLYNLERNPDQRYLLLRMLSVPQIDISGIHMLEHVLRAYRERAGDLFLVRVQRPVFEFMDSTGFVDILGEDHFLHEDTAISHIFYRVLDPAVCIYECELRVFYECQNLPKRTLAQATDLHTSTSHIQLEMVAPRHLWEQLRGAHPPLICDVREPREFQRAHIPGAQSLPLPDVLTGPVDLPHDRPIVLACRTGRRSTRAAQSLQQQGYKNVHVLNGGLVAWEAAGLLEAVDLNIPDGR